MNTKVYNSSGYKKKSVAYRNILILLFSILPFLLGVGYSAAKSSNMDYFGVSINISGSQRMRTMLIANYSQQIEDAINENDESKLLNARDILKKEIKTYEEFMEALVYGSSKLQVDANVYDHIIREIESFESSYRHYISSAELLLNGPVDSEVVDEIVDLALPLKNNIHKVVGMFETQYQKEMKLLTILDVIMILIAVTVTFLGFVLTRAIKKNEFYANFDHLTGLLTRFNLYENIKYKTSSDYDVYFIDLNKFKLVNDTFGHSVGDEILKEAANRLITVFGMENTYRYGGDEFVILSNDKYRDIRESALELSNRFVLPIVDSKHREHFISLSIGAVKKGIGPLEWHNLIHFADELMYEAKNFTGHTVICDSAEDAEKRLNLDFAILDGIDKKEFKPHFQPIYNVSSEALEMQMVLCRWHQKNGNVMMPKDFLPVLKRKGLLAVFDLYMIKQVNTLYEHMSEREKSFTYSINLTEETLIGAHYNELLTTIEDLSIPHDKLILKFKEDVLLNDDIKAILELISSKGYQLAVNNFTIDISLNESDKYKNIDIIKLGMQTAKPMISDGYARKVLQEFIHMLVAIDKVIIIEGIEEASEIQVLKSINENVKGKLYYSTPYKLLSLDELHLSQ